MQDKVKVYILVDDDGFEIEPIIFELYDENGNLNEVPYDLVPPNVQGFVKPKWDFEKEEWTEGDLPNALIQAKRAVINQYDYECTKFIEKGFLHNGDFFSFSLEKDQANFQQQLSICLAFPNAEGIEWKTENNGVKTYSKDEFFAICKAGETHKRSNMSAYWKLIDYINANVQDLETLHSLGTFEQAKALVQ